MTHTPEVENAAADWISVADAANSPPPETRAALQKWLEASPQHQAAYVRLWATWQRADALRRLLPADGRVDPDLLAPQKNSDSNERKSAFARLPWAAASFGVVVVFVIGGIYCWHALKSAEETVYRTNIGEFRRVRLEDGSTVQLNTATEARVILGNTSRTVKLLKGEAYFDVAPERARPFNVTAGSSVIRAVGTSFAVRRRSQSLVDVVVRTGRVAIAPKSAAADRLLPPGTALLSAGEASTFKESSQINARRVSEETMTRMLAWRRQMLWFEGETLAVAVQEFNRYNESNKLEIADPSIAGFRVGGRFAAERPEDFVKGLEEFGITGVYARNTDGEPRVTQLVSAKR